MLLLVGASALLVAGFMAALVLELRASASLARDRRSRPSEPERVAFCPTAPTIANGAPAAVALGDTDATAAVERVDDARKQGAPSPERAVA